MTNGTRVTKIYRNSLRQHSIFTYLKIIMFFIPLYLELILKYHDIFRKFLENHICGNSLKESSMQNYNKILWIESTEVYSMIVKWESNALALALQMEDPGECSLSSPISRNHLIIHLWLNLFCLSLGWTKRRFVFAEARSRINVLIITCGYTSANTYTHK